MSHFYAMISNSARKTTPTARGHKTTGVDVDACAWGGKVSTIVRHVDGQDQFEVWMMPHQGSGDTFMIASGIIGDSSTVVHDPLGKYSDVSTEELLNALHESDKMS